MDYTRYLWLVWDLAAILVMIYCVWSGAAKGLVRTAVSLLGFVAAGFLANMLSPTLSQLLYDNVVRDILRELITKRMEELAYSGGETAEQLLHVLPGILRELISTQALDSVSVGQLPDAVALVEALVDAVLREPVLALLGGILFLIIFSLVLLVARQVSRMFTVVYRIPVIGAVNTVLGGVVGVLEAIIVLLVVGIACQLVITFSSGGFSWLNHSLLDATYIFRVFYQAVQF